MLDTGNINADAVIRIRIYHIGRYTKLKASCKPIDHQPFKYYIYSMVVTSYLEPAQLDEANL